MVLEVLFWLLLILTVIGIFTPDSTDRAYLPRARFGMLLIPIAILGLAQFHNPLTH